jgi:ribosomal protein S27E
MVFAGQRGTQTVSLNAVLNRYEALGFNVDNVRRAQSVLDRQDFTVRQWQFSPPTGAPGPCDLGPCYRDVTGGFNREIGLPDRFTGLINGLRQGDYQAFNRFRESQCQAMRGTQITGGAGLVAAGAGCGTVLLEFTGGGAAVGGAAGGGIGAAPGAGIGAVLGGLACLAGSVIVASEAAELQRQTRDCKSQYPGPGNWEGSTLPRGF